MAPVLAHAGHWLMWILYLVPVVIVLIATAKAFIDGRREDAATRRSPSRG